MEQNIELEQAKQLLIRGDLTGYFHRLIELTADGNSSAEFQAGIVATQSKLLFLASDLWNDLLDHFVEPRQDVAARELEIRIWTGNFQDARSFAKSERLPSSLLEKSGYTDFASDFETLSSTVAQFIFKLNRIQLAQSRSESFENRIAELETRANLATLASQLHFNPEHIDRAVHGVSGDQFFEIDLEEQLGDAEKYWTGVRDVAGILIGDLSENGPHAKESISKVAKIGQEAQERLFFFRRAMSIDEEEKGYLQNIALGLEGTSQIASDYYLRISQLI